VGVLLLPLIKLCLPAKTKSRYMTREATTTMILTLSAASLLLASMLDQENTENTENTESEILYKIDALHKILDAQAGVSYGADPPQSTPPSRSEPLGPLFLSMTPSDVPDDLLIAILISGATGNKSPVDVANELLKNAKGNLSHIGYRTNIDKTSGLGSMAQARLIASSELERRVSYRKAIETKTSITNPGIAAAILRTMSLGEHERLSAIYLDRRRRVITSQVLSIGSAGYTIVDPIVILRPAIELNAQSIILAHQHPSGDITPSAEDRSITQKVAAACRVVGIPLLDHIIIGYGENYTSLAEMGYVPTETDYYDKYTK
jgi:DNA repair protein RadC